LDEERNKKIIKDRLNPIATRIVWDISDAIFEPIGIDLSAKENIERCVLDQILQSFPYGKITDEVLKLKEMFIKSIDVHAVDKFIEKILEGKKIQKEEEEEWIWDWRMARF